MWGKEAGNCDSWDMGGLQIGGISFMKHTDVTAT